jgi:hypothetical protein
MIFVCYKTRTLWNAKVFPAAKGAVSGSISVPHNSDGTKSITVVFSTSVYNFGSVDYGGSMTLTKIDRTALPLHSEYRILPQTDSRVQQLPLLLLTYGSTVQTAVQARHSFLQLKVRL